jgi:hypothetical protein
VPDQASICHIASQQAVNSKVELKYALSQAGFSATADASAKMRLCSNAKGENPSVILPAAANSVQYSIASSTCAAVPSETASACAAAARLDVLPRECDCTDPLVSCSLVQPGSAASIASLCFALVRAQTNKERSCGQSFPCIQPAHTTQPHCTLADGATSATGHPVPVSLDVRVCSSTEPASKRFCGASSLSRMRILPIDHTSSSSPTR